MDRATTQQVATMPVEFKLNGDTVEHVELGIFEPPRFFEAFLRGRQYTEPPDITARIESYEMAYRLQHSAPELSDLSSEPQHILDLYGIKDIKKPGFARNCLLARRLIERGVRFVQLFHEAWDQHANLTKLLKQHRESGGIATLAADGVRVVGPVIETPGMVDGVVWAPSHSEDSMITVPSGTTYRFSSRKGRASPRCIAPSVVSPSLRSSGCVSS